MRSGFIIESSLCVSCKACAAACLIENEWEGVTRSIYSYNDSLSESLPIINISIACNHCETAACLNSCPASAYLRDESSGAVIINREECLGCGYCTWNCPWGAPVLEKGGVVVKCNKCYPRLNEGIEPACTAACPTGALAFGDHLSEDIGSAPDWFPGNELNPAINFIATSLPDNPEIIGVPDTPVSLNNYQQSRPEIEVFHWSLLIFSTIIPIAVALTLKQYLSGAGSASVIVPILALAGALLSLFHLTRPLKAYRALLNIRKSALSREIAALAVFTALSIASAAWAGKLLISLTAVSGLIMLWLIDNVYTSVDNSRRTIYHSGQLFLSGLMLASFLLEREIAFIFIALLRIGLTFRWYPRESNKMMILAILRVILILPAVVYLLDIISPHTAIILVLLIIGEFSDRYLYYRGITITHINTEISKHIKNEKERG